MNPTPIKAGEDILRCTLVQKGLGENMKVKKAVILAAGFGSRMLPATKAVPKEMLTIVDKPSIQYIVEELADSGITDILIVLSRGKGAVQEHFDRHPELEAALSCKSQKLYDELLQTAKIADITYIRQPIMRGSGSAVLLAKGFAGDEPIAVVYPDDIMVSTSVGCRGNVPSTAQGCHHNILISENSPTACGSTNYETPTTLQGCQDGAEVDGGETPPTSQGCHPNNAGVGVYKKPVTMQICEAYEKYGLGAVAMKEFPAAEITKYSSLDAKLLENNLYRITDMIEKPAPEQIFTNFSILGRCVLPPKIFPILEQTKPGLGGEIWLTDAMKRLANEDGMTGVDFDGVRFDTGNKLGLMKAVTEIALAHREIGAEYRNYLKDLPI